MVLSSVEGTLLTGFFVLATTITQENPTRKNLFWPFRQAVNPGAFGIMKPNAPERLAS